MRGEYLMEYNAGNHSFLCERCGPNQNKWKNIYTSILVNEETGDCFCIVHHLSKIGNTNMIPEWRDN